MTDQQQDERESVFLNTFPRRMRRNALADIFENNGFRENFRSFSSHTTETTLNSDGETDSMSDENLDESQSEDLGQGTENSEQYNLANCGTAGSKETTKVLPLQISQEERLGGSSLPICRDANRPSCLTNICTAATSSPNFGSSNLSPSAEMLTINFPDDSTSDLLSPDPNTSNWFSTCRTRRNALHNLLETLTEEDRQKLKYLYQATLANASSYSLNSPYPIRNLHECTA